MLECTLPDLCPGDRVIVACRYSRSRGRFVALHGVFRKWRGSGPVCVVDFDHPVLNWKGRRLTGPSIHGENCANIRWELVERE